MSSRKWNTNWSIENNIIFKLLINIFLSYYHQKIAQIFKRNHIHGETVLELGCGTAGETIWILKNLDFKRATVVDFSQKALGKVRETKGNLPITPVYGDIVKLHFKEKYDLVHSAFVIEHFYGCNRLEVIKAHAQNVKKNGFVFIQAPGKTSLSLLYSNTINKLNGIEEQLYEKEELLLLFRKANLDLIECVSLFGGAIYFCLAKKL
jgi:2-polyprenyl-3-methyl-5-hydroxy-6-metoxy-1,4-benzoquinol methylase